MREGESEAFWRVLGKLQDARPAGKEWKARCPVHDDKEPSLYLSTGRDGRALLLCRANRGCTVDRICAALGLTVSDLFERSPEGQPWRRWLHTAEDGRPVGLHTRRLPKDYKWEGGLQSRKTADLPLWPLSELLGWEKGSRVYVCEGEPAAQSLLDRGIQAVATVTGAAGTPSVDTLRALVGFDVVLWPDNDEPGLGHMGRVRGVLEGLGVRPGHVVWDTAPPKGDAADFEGDADAVAALVVAGRGGPEILGADALLRKEFRAPSWAVPNVLPEGLTILGGRPKMGKSWLALNLSIEIARAGMALRKFRCDGGDVLYMALEDGQRRIQKRLELVLQGQEAPSRLFVTAEWPKLDDGGLVLLEEWLQTHRRAVAVFIDTFKRVRGQEDVRKRLYDLDYDSLAPLQALAMRYGVAIVVVFHTRKGDSEDPVELISGTLGLTGVADAIMVLRRERGQADASLFITGRDVEERDLGLKLYGQGGTNFGWEYIGPAEDFRTSKQRQAILDVIREQPGQKPAEIAGAVGKTQAAVRQLLFKMVHEGSVRVRDGFYYPPVKIGNADNGGHIGHGVYIHNSNDADSAASGEALTPGSPITGIATTTDVSTTTDVTPVIPVTARVCVDCNMVVGPYEKRCQPCFRRWAGKEDEDAPL